MSLKDVNNPEIYNFVKNTKEYDDIKLRGSEVAEPLSFKILQQIKQETQQNLIKEREEKRAENRAPQFVIKTLISKQVLENLVLQDDLRRLEEEYQKSNQNEIQKKEIKTQKNDIKNQKYLLMFKKNQYLVKQYDQLYQKIRKNHQNLISKLKKEIITDNIDKTQFSDPFVSSAKAIKISSLIYQYYSEPQKSAQFSYHAKKTEIKHFTQLQIQRVSYWSDKIYIYYNSDSVNYLEYVSYFVDLEFEPLIPVFIVPDQNNQIQKKLKVLKFPFKYELIKSSRENAESVKKFIEEQKKKLLKDKYSQGIELFISLKSLPKCQNQQQKSQNSNDNNNENNNNNYNKYNFSVYEQESQHFEYFLFDVAVALNVLVEKGNMIIKFYSGNLRKTVYLIYLLSKSFYSVKINKLVTSSPFSNEIILFCSTYLKPISIMEQILLDYDKLKNDDDYLPVDEFTITQDQNFIQFYDNIQQAILKQNKNFYDWLDDGAIKDEQLIKQKFSEIYKNEVGIHIQNLPQNFILHEEKKKQNFLGFSDDEDYVIAQFSDDGEMLDMFQKNQDRQANKRKERENQQEMKQSQNKQLQNQENNDNQNSNGKQNQNKTQTSTLNNTISQISLSTPEHIKIQRQQQLKEFKRKQKLQKLQQQEKEKKKNSDQQSQKRKISEKEKAKQIKKKNENNVNKVYENPLDIFNSVKN